VNVLQAMIMTKGDKMVLTPTYHVFEVYKVHQGATDLPVSVDGPYYTYGGKGIPAVSASASRDAKGLIHVSLVNVDPNNAAKITCTISGASVKSVSGRVLTAPQMDTHNTFEMPDAVQPVAFEGAKIDNDVLTVEMPSKSVVVLELK
jgi:alpha-L-arabinofuranosidase